MYNRKLNITESEQQRIKNLYQKSNDYVFDFVLTENNKYLIIMDQVFVNGGDGNTIGSIWEHTYIFDEILKESFDKLGVVTEDVQNIINKITWDKNYIKEWIKEKPVIVEDWFDNLKSGASTLLNKIGSSAMNVAKTAWNQGVIPFLRWIRRGLYTDIGIVIDVIVSILAVKSNAIVWGIIVLLDIYEISTGDFDPQDPSRKEMPYLLLIGDLLAVLFTSGVSKGFKASVNAIKTTGIKALDGTMIKYLKSLYTNIPTLKTTIKNAGQLLSSKMGGKSSGIINSMLTNVDKILDSLKLFIHKLFSKEGAKATAMGVGTLGLVKGMEYGLNKVTGGGNTQALSTAIKYNPNAGYTDDDFKM